MREREREREKGRRREREGSKGQRFLDNDHRGIVVRSWPLGCPYEKRNERSTDRLERGHSAFARRVNLPNIMEIYSRREIHSRNGFPRAVLEHERNSFSSPFDETRIPLLNSLTNARSFRFRFVCTFSSLDASSFVGRAERERERERRRRVCRTLGSFKIK